MSDYETTIAGWIAELRRVPSNPILHLTEDWTEGRMPRTPEELLGWATRLDAAADHAKAERDAARGLLGVVAVQATSAGGISFRELARALSCSPGRVQALVDAGRVTLAQRQKGGSDVG